MKRVVPPAKNRRLQIAFIDFVARSEFSIEARRVSNLRALSIFLWIQSRRAVKRATHAHASGERGQHRQLDKNRRRSCMDYVQSKNSDQHGDACRCCVVANWQEGEVVLRSARHNPPQSGPISVGRGRAVPAFRSLLAPLRCCSQARLGYYRKFARRGQAPEGKLHWHHHASRNGAMILERPRRSNGPRSPIRKTDDQN